MKFNPITGQLENSGIPEAPSDGKQWARKDGAWVQPTAAGISDSTAAGREMLTAADAAVQRSLLSALDPLTLSYIAIVGITNPTDIARIDGFFSTLRTAGVASALADGVLFPSQYNVAGESVKTITGGTCSLSGSNALTRSGLSLNGSSQYAQFSIAPTTGAVTVMFEYNGTRATIPSLATYFSLTGTAGYNTSCLAALTNSGVLGETYQEVFNKQGSTEKKVGTWSASGTGAHWYLAMMNGDVNLRTFAVTNDNASPSNFGVWADGQPGALYTVGGYYDSTGVQVTTPNSVVTVGARFASAGSFSNYVAGTYRSMLVFNRVLTGTEIAAVEYALRWLYPSDQNVIFIGDSTTFSNPVEFDYPSMLGNTPMFQGKRVYNLGKNGDIAGNAYTYFDEFATIPGRRPGGPVKNTEIFFRMGINDAYQSRPAADTYAAISGIVNKAKAAGCVIHTMTLTNGNFEAYTAVPAMRSIITGFNSLLLATPLGDPPMYRGDLIAPTYTDSNVFLNALHMKKYGNSLWAMEILSGGTFGRTIKSGTDSAVLYSSGTTAGF